MSILGYQQDITIMSKSSLENADFVAKIYAAQFNFSDI